MTMAWQKVGLDGGLGGLVVAGCCSLVAGNRNFTDSCIPSAACAFLNQDTI